MYRMTLRKAKVVSTLRIYNYPLSMESRIKTCRPAFVLPKIPWPILARCPLGTVSRRLAFQESS